MNSPGESLSCFCAGKSEEKIHEMGKRNPPALQNQALHYQNKILQSNNWEIVMQHTLRVLCDSHSIICVSHTPGLPKPHSCLFWSETPQGMQIPYNSKLLDNSSEIGAEQMGITQHS